MMYKSYLKQNFSISKLLTLIYIWIHSDIIYYCLGGGAGNYVGLTTYNRDHMVCRNQIFTIWPFAMIANPDLKTFICSFLALMLFKWMFYIIHKVSKECCMPFKNIKVYTDRICIHRYTELFIPKLFTHIHQIILIS